MHGQLRVPVKRTFVSSAARWFSRRVRADASTAALEIHVCAEFRQASFSTPSPPASARMRNRFSCERSILMHLESPEPLIMEALRSI